MMTKTRGNSADELWIATCGCLLLLVCWGLTYGMPVMFPFLADRFAVPVWHFAACFSIGGAIYFSIGSLAGAVADRYGTPIVVAVGSLISAAGFLIASLATSELVFAIGYIIGIGSGVGLDICAGDRGGAGAHHGQENRRGRHHLSRYRFRLNATSWG